MWKTLGGKEEHSSQGLLWASYQELTFTFEGFLWHVLAGGVVSVQGLFRLLGHTNVCLPAKAAMLWSSLPKSQWQATYQGGFRFSWGFLRGLKVKVKSFSHVWLFATPWTVAYQAPPPIGVSRPEYWSGVPFPSPEDLPHPGIESRSPAL